MTDFWVAVGLLVVVVVGSLLWAMLRRPRQSAARLSYDLAVYKDQLAELELDVERGTLNETEADAARAEIERRILAIADQDGETASPAASGGPGRMIAIGIVGLAVPAFSIGIYLYLGSPKYPDIPFAGRDIAQEDNARQRGEKTAEIGDLATKLAQRLAAEPNNLRGWLLLGRTYLTMEREADALAALRKARALAPDDPAVATELAEALVINNKNQVGAEARALFQAALSGDARGPRARYYLALADAQDGKLAEALQGWVDLLAVSPPDAPWRATVNSSIERAAADLKVDPATVKPSLAAKLLGPGKPKPETETETTAPPPTSAPTSAPGPSREDMEAASQMSAGDRMAMIKSMVQRLAERLKENPDDLAGWQRLARAYRVLGETKKAEDAEAQIKRLGQ